MAAPATAQQPLSVIDWLGAQQTPVAAPIAPKEPPVAKTAVAPAVSVKPLAEGGPRQIGLVPPDVTGLPASLWLGSDAGTLARLITTLPDPVLPAAQSLLFTLLLTEALGPGGRADAGEALAMARVRKLIALGALDPAQSLIEQISVSASPAHFDLWMQISLLTGTEERACALLSAAPHLTADYGIRIFCDARAGRWQNAALTLGSAQALELLPPGRLQLLARFLDPETASDLLPALPPRDMDPLSFRLFEAIGEPIPTGNLPRAYAVADLRDLAGWKTRLEAVERLTRAGALPDNHLLGLYADGRPAASGGVWDRVAGLQRFETALRTGSTEAVTKTLPPIWDAMVEAGLAVTFANLFADELARFDLSGHAAGIARTVQLLAPGYETAAVAMDTTALAPGIARGELPARRPAEPRESAVYAAFAGSAPRNDLLELARQDRLGEAILRCLSLLDKGTQGDTQALRDALATLRALGLEDTARRAALQIILLDI